MPSARRLNADMTAFTLSLLLLNVLCSSAASHRLKRQAEDDCVCVDYWICGEDNKVIVDGAGIIDKRFGEIQKATESCPGVQVCCGLPDGYNNGGSGGGGGNDNRGEPPPPVDVDPVIPPPPPPVTGGGSIVIPQRPNQMTGCGVRRVLPFGHIEDRITGPSGEPQSTFFGEFPWMIALLKKDSTGRDTFACGASLIRPNVVLTAAHCVNGAVPAEITAVAGEWDSRIEDEPIKAQSKRVTKILIHENFSSTNLKNDVALLFLESAYQLNEAIDTICLTNEKFSPSDCHVTGWGKNKFNEAGLFQPTLKKVRVPLIDRDQCQSKLRTTRLGQYFKLHDSFICAGAKGADACSGDGGGPLVCANHENDHQRFAQLGIVSWGIDCGIGNPGVYSSVSHFYDWINNHIEKA